MISPFNVMKKSEGKPGETTQKALSWDVAFSRTSGVERALLSSVIENLINFYLLLKILLRIFLLFIRRYTVRNPPPFLGNPPLFSRARIWRDLVLKGFLDRIILNYWNNYRIIPNYLNNYRIIRIIQ